MSLNLESSSSPIGAAYEFSGVSLGDTRLNKRVLQIVNTIQASPSKSFPELFRDANQMKAAYRFISNENVESDSIIKPHQKKTIERAKSSSIVLAIHDTTDFKFTVSDVEDLGVIDPSNQSGFYSHLSLCLDGSGQPLGIARFHAWYRMGSVHGKIPQSISQYLPDREYLRWNEAVHEVDDSIKSACNGTNSPTVIHVMDRESDCLELMADMVENNRLFVLRAKTDRRIEAGRHKTDNKLFSAVASSKVLYTQTTSIVTQKATRKCDKIENPERKGGRERKQQRKWRETRDANLEVRSIKKTIYAGNGGHAHVPQEGIALSIVQINEVDPPSNVSPVCWNILTNLPVETPEQAKAILDIYRHRWVIEEYIKVIKTGCEYQKHQFSHGDHFIKALMIYIPIAFQMLKLRWLERFQSNTQVNDVLEKDQLEALGAYRKRQGKPISKNPSISEILSVIAILGGHLSTKEPPGWLVISRGFNFLNDLTLGWQTARDYFLSASTTKSTDPKLTE